MNKKLQEMTILELAQVQGNQYQELMRVQNNLLQINSEIERRSNDNGKTEDIA